MSDEDNYEQMDALDSTNVVPLHRVDQDITSDYCGDCGTPFFFINRFLDNVWYECANPNCGELYALIGEFPDPEDL